MQSAIDSFKGCMLRARELGGLHSALSTLTTSAVDASDLLRAQLVLGVSAFDHYIHEVTVLGMVECFNGTRHHTNAYTKFRVPIGVALPVNASTSSSWFENEIRERHSFLSFQHPDKVADAIRLISACSLWREIGIRLGVAEVSVKTRQKLIVERRNKIAHEADLDPSYPDTRWPIGEQDVEDALSHLEKVARSIQVIVTCG